MLSEAEIRAFAPDAKIALLATRDSGGEPRVSLITTLQAKSPTQLMWGQFCEGESKRNVQARPEVGFLVMNAERQLWRGRARWTGCVREGEDYELYNRKPIYRYNTYFGIHTVHHMDLVELGPREGLSLPGIGVGTVAAQVEAPLFARRRGPSVLSSLTRQLLGGLSSLRFLSWVDEEGFPRLLPVLPGRAAGGARVVLAPSVYRKELSRIPEGAPVALFAMNMQMQSVLVRGRYSTRRPLGLLVAALIDVDYVYNTMPPLPGVIYPRSEHLAPVGR